MIDYVQCNCKHDVMCNRWKISKPVLKEEAAGFEVTVVNHAKKTNDSEMCKSLLAS
jgi:hypothetical protein